MTAPNTSRRRLMQTGTALGISALAGCSQLSGVLGSDGGSPYTSWLPAPDEVSNRDHYEFLFLRPVVWEEHEDQIADGLYAKFSRGLGSFVSVYAGIDFGEMDTATVTTGNTTIVTHQRDEADVVAALEDVDFDKEDEADGFAIYVSEDGNTAAGVSNSTLVLAQGGFFPSSDSIDIVETHVDTIAGEDRYVDESEDMATLVDHLGGPSLAVGETHEELPISNVQRGVFDHQVASGGTLELGAETSTVTSVRVLEDADDIDPDDADDWAESDTEFDDLDDPTAEVSGRSIIVTGNIDTDDIGPAQL